MEGGEVLRYILSGNTIKNNHRIGIEITEGATSNSIVNNTVTGNIVANIVDAVGGNTDFSGNTAP